MTVIRMTILAMLLVAGSLAGQPLAQGERDMAMSHLHASRKLLLDSIDGLSAAQWNFKPAPNRWSAAEVVEHLAVCEDALYKEVTEEIIKKPPISEEEIKKQRDKDALVLETVVNSDQKLQAEPSQQPIGRWASKEAVIRHFKESRDRAIAYIETTEEELRRHVVSHPTLEQLDAYQCFLVLSAHVERHVAQIQQVKQHPDFPKE